VSGGADSLAMFALAVAAGCRAHAVHVDHGLRTTGEADAGVVEAAAHRLGATFEVVKVEVAAGPNLEARARAARYGALPEGVLVAHTADDLAETLLLNLLRGAGAEGLGGLRAEGGGPRRARRPILKLRRAETAALVAALGLTVATDESNFDPSFRRNRVRHEVLPLLADVSGRDPVPVLARTAALLAADAALLSELAGELDPTDTRSLRSAPRALASRALRAWLRAEEGVELHPPSSDDIERAWAVVTGQAKACEIAGGKRLSRRAGRLRLEAGRLAGP